MTFSFVVPGVPAPQGSKARNPQGGMREDNPRTKPWREAVAYHALAARNGQQLLQGQATIEVIFYLPRPKGHFRRDGTLKPSVTRGCPKPPDADKLLRCVFDALTGVLVRDDAQFVEVRARKLYGDPRAEITVAGV